MKSTLRSRFIGLLTGGIYARSIRNIINNNLIISLLGICIVFMLFHFLYIDIRKHAAKRYIIGIIIITFGELLQISSGQWNTMIGIILINSIFLLLALHLKEQLRNYTRVKLFPYFMRSGYLGITGIALAYSTMSLGVYTKFPLSCDQLKNGINIIIENVGKPFNRTSDTILGTKETLQKGLQGSMGDLLQVSKNISLQDSSQQGGVLNTITQRKNNLIDNTIKEQSLLSQNICEYSLTTINSKLASPTVQTPVIVLLAIFLLPWLRILFYIINSIGRICCRICLVMGIYHIEETTKPGEDIG